MSTKHIKDITGDSLNINGEISVTDITFNGCLISEATAGEALEEGDVLKVSTTVDRQVIKADSVGNEFVVGVACSDANSGATVKMAVGGEFQIKVTGAVTRGNFLKVSSTDGVAIDNTAAGNPGDFAIAMNSDADTGIKLVWARFVKAELS